ncbi:Hsp20/alpha crystallin family protein [Betaproteobacteria bacterium SCN2]|jgi:HSP20 family protein|nr:Hsp20/alpha crystallin family protein [Betaproteobacteria bacterium SCN2]
MANLTRYDPFETGIEPFDDLFRGFFRPVRMDRELPQFKMDVKENEKAYTVHADLPGMKKEDIHVSIEGNTVAISAETRSESEQKESEKVLKRERSYGKVYRSFSLGADIDEASATARYNDGVLELVLPKKMAVASKRLAVE